MCFEGVMLQAVHPYANREKERGLGETEGAEAGITNSPRLRDQRETSSLKVLIV